VVVAGGGQAGAVPGLWPVRVWRSLPVAGSRIRTVEELRGLASHLRSRRDLQDPAAWGLGSQGHTLLEQFEAAQHEDDQR
jgi:hypothetical protein